MYDICIDLDGCILELAFRRPGISSAWMTREIKYLNHKSQQNMMWGDTFYRFNKCSLLGFCDRLAGLEHVHKTLGFVYRFWDWVVVENI